MNFVEWVEKQEAKYKRRAQKNVVVENDDELRIITVPAGAKVAGRLATVHPVFGPNQVKFLHISELNQIVCDWQKLRDDWVKQGEAWNEMPVIDRFKNSVLKG
jgi:hypothetical protein